MIFFLFLMKKCTEVDQRTINKETEKFKNATKRDLMKIKRIISNKI